MGDWLSVMGDESSVISKGLSEINKQLSFHIFSSNFLAKELKLKTNSQ